MANELNNNPNVQQQQQPATVQINVNKTQTQQQNVPVIEPDKSEKVVSITDDDIAVGTEAKKAVEQSETDKVDLDAVIKEYQETIQANNEDRQRNLDKIVPAIPLSEYDNLTKYAERVINESAAKGAAALGDQLEDWLSDYHTAQGAGEYYSAANEMLKKSIATVKPEDLVRELPGVAEGNAYLGQKYITASKNGKVFSGDEAYRIFATLTSGVRKVVLWNSGITLTLKNLPIRMLDQYLEAAAHDDYEYGKEYGGWYYLFSSLALDQHICEKILPNVIIGSNYKDWTDTNKLLSQISLQDYQVILWSLACLMYPTGTTINYVCAEPDCGHVHSEKVDLTKLRLNNKAMINDEMIKHFTENRHVDDAALEKYRASAHLEDSFSIDISDDPGEIKRYTFFLKQCSIADHLRVGKAYNAELKKTTEITNRDSVLRYITLNQNRNYIPWIKSIRCTLIREGQDPLDINMYNDIAGDNDISIDMMMDEFQQRVPEFTTKLQNYIQRTAISHIAFFFEKCPKCGAKPVISYNGYIPYDMTQAFFTLGRMKLWRISYQQNEQAAGKNTSQDTVNS